MRQQRNLEQMQGILEDVQLQKGRPQEDGCEVVSSAGGEGKGRDESTS